MFNNLIESSSHTKEYKRRGSFLLFTGAVYVALFAVTGVVSIYAYDAHLEQQILDDVVLLSPQDIVPTQEPAPAARPERPRDTTNNNTSNVTERAVAMLSVNHPEVVPKDISATASKNPPLPDGVGIVAITGRNRDAGSIGPVGPSTGREVVQPRQIVTIPDDPPPPQQQPIKTLRVSRVLNSEALSLPPPSYPPIARQTRTQGTVIVQVLIDEEGKVVSAKATSGHVLLVPAAQTAALRARFSPTVLGDQKVKVQGVITYNFVLGN